jgi:hypothetical protein
MGNSIQTPEYAFCDCDVKNYFDKEIINSKPVSMNSDSSFNLEETDDKKSMMGGSIPKFKNTSSYMYGYNMTGGFNAPIYREDPARDELENALKELNKELSNQTNMTGGNGNKFKPDNNQTRNRYEKYNVFKVLNKLEKELHGGMDMVNGTGNGENNSENIAMSNSTMDHIKGLIFDQLNKLENNNQHGAGGCGCEETKSKSKSKLVGGRRRDSSSSSSDSSSDSSSTSSSSSSSSSASTSSDSSSSESSSREIKQYKKTHNKMDNKKTHNKMDNKKTHNKKEEPSSDFAKVEPDSDDSNSNSNGTSNGITEEGLSIFPFNSSDVKSSVSVKNYKMLRRNI